MNKTMASLISAALLCAASAQIATAGYIVNGKEWEVRGTPAIWTDHQTTQAPADTGWTWATYDDWTASGLENIELVDPDWSALMGGLDGDAVFAAAWLATTFVQNNEDLAYYLVPSLAADDTHGRMNVSANQRDLFDRYRMSYRNVNVPVPPTLPLIGLSLVLMGWSRRKRNQ